MTLLTLIGLPLLSATWIAAPARAAETIVVDALLGNSHAVVFHPGDMKPSQLVKGIELQAHDEIVTSNHGGVRIRYPDGSLLAIGGDSRLILEPKHGETQRVNLDRGQAHAQIQKKGDLKPNAPPRYIIKTPNTVMGVRGTEFVVDYDPATQQTALHTLEGTVEMAGDEKQVVESRGALVSAIHCATLSGQETSALPTVTSFDMRNYQKQLEASHPEFLAVSAPSTGPPSVEPFFKPDTPDVTDEPPPEPLSGWAQFRIGAISIVQNGDFRFTVGEVGWVPSFHLGGSWALRGDIAGAPIRLNQDSRLITIAKTSLLADFTASHSIHFEGGGGVEAFSTQDFGVIACPILMLNGVSHFKPVFWIDSIYAGLEFVATSRFGGPLPIALSLGIGMRF